MNKTINNIGNYYEIKDNTAYITVLKKDGTELITIIDAENLESITNMGTWFAEWNKDYNNYIVQNISSTKKNKKSKPLKQSLQSVILNVNPKAPIRHINGNTLDNRKCNLEIFNQNTINEYEKNDGVISIILKDKYGKKEGTALISEEDLSSVINDKYSWVLHKTHNKISVVANTPEGRIHLENIIIPTEENHKIEHINNNPLDNRRNNLKLTPLEIEE